MRERLLVLALGAAAFALFYALIFPKPSSAPATIVRPLSKEAGPDGYLAAWRWLGEQHIPAVSLRYRYDRLAGLAPRSSGNVLLVSMPQRVPTRAAELVPLENWIERGNTLVVMAALDDTPLWTLGADPLLFDRIGRITGLKFSSPTPKTPDAGQLKALLTDQLDIQPRSPHALLAGVHHVTALSPLPVGRWQASVESGLMPLELATRSDDGDPAVWLERRGAGQIVLYAVGSAFSNAALALTDNARLFANLLAWSLGPGGAVIFDDAHQGETAFYDGRAFFADPRLHHTFGWMLLVWLAFVVGSLPLRAGQRAWQPIDEAAYVEASARYFASVVPPSDAAQRLIEDFLEALRQRLNLGAETSFWTWLAEQGGVSTAQLRALQASYARACAGERVDLIGLQNLLAQLKRSLE